METDFDDILKTVAKRFVQNTEIDTLGKKLGFTPEEVQRYIATNSQSQQITCFGTLQMLRDWRKKQVPSTERPTLKTALEASGFIRLADEIFGERSAGHSATASVTASQGAVSADRSASAPQTSIVDAVSDGQLNTLADQVPPEKYYSLSDELGIGYNQAKGILAKNLNDFAKAIRECLGIWKDRTGGSSADLKEILDSESVALGGTLGKYIR